MFNSRIKVQIDYRIWIVIQAVFIMAWMTNLAGTDALYSIYALCGIVCVFCLSDNCLHKRFKPERGFGSCILIALLFSLVTFFANYEQFAKIWYMDSLSYPTNIIKNSLNSVCSLIGGTFVSYQIVLYAVFHFPRQNKYEERKYPNKLFWFTFVSVTAIDLIYLFLDEYPGHISPDSLYQIIQGYTCTYVNDHPFWHTLCVKWILTIGYSLFASPNGAVAFFSVVQILCMAACFGYALMTLYQSNVPKWFIGIAYTIYVLMPYNIAYSITMWKDVSFGLSVLILVISVFRLIHKLGTKQIINYLLFVVGALGVCLTRTNGFAVFLFFALFALGHFMKRDKRLILLILFVILLAWMLTGPVLTALGVGQTDVAEGFSVPLQQIARVVYKGCSLKDSQTELLSKIFDLEKIPEIYTEWYADPIKIELHENNYAYFRDNLSEYIHLWIELGAEYPMEYMEAWIEQTKGYWNGGYAYHQYLEVMQENDFGITKSAGNNVISKLIDLYFGFTRQSVFFEPLNSIGLHVWILVLCCFLNLRNRRYEWLLCVPALVIIAGLMIGTPVFCEFRYAYPVFTTIPFIAAVTLFQTKTE